MIDAFGCSRPASTDARRNFWRSLFFAAMFSRSSGSCALESFFDRRLIVFCASTVPSSMTIRCVRPEPGSSTTSPGANCSRLPCI
eukprot:2829391-Prymnesium_polylepis.1